MPHRIRSLSIIGGFLDGQRFDLAGGLNCFIGARGTGKTTVLELVRYGLDVPAPNIDGVFNSLIERNLDGGRVQLDIETTEGLCYTVRRDCGEPPILLNANGETPDDLQLSCLFRADIFSQNHIEGMADSAEAQLALIDGFAREQLNAIEDELKKINSQLSANAGHLVPLAEQDAALDDEIRTLPSTQEKLKGLTVSGEEASAVEKAHVEKAARHREKLAIDGLVAFVRGFSDEIGHQQGRFHERINALFNEELLGSANGRRLTDLHSCLLRSAATIDDLLRRIRTVISEECQYIEDFCAGLQTVHAQQETEFRTLIEKSGKLRSQAAERSRLEKQRNELLTKKQARASIAAKVDHLNVERKALLGRLSELRDQRFAVRKEIARKVTSQLSPTIRVGVFQDGNTSPYQRLLEDIIKKQRMRPGKTVERLAQAVAPACLADAVRRKDGRYLVDTAQLTPEQADKVILVFSAPEILCEVETVDLLDLPRIELKDGEEYKSVAALSTGQKCTAILPILLLDSDNPLLVDQPEDNLDNRFIYETVVETVRKIKTRRQLIFVTHNPNIPVLGDAERVFVLESNGQRSRKANEGTVDECKDEIVTLLEGGVRAFQERQRRYAY